MACTTDSRRTHRLRTPEPDHFVGGTRAAGLQAGIPLPVLEHRQHRRRVDRRAR
jgi:hypothetical protein